ncbi:sulfite exporter TauE/SafE family protein [Athalassotoga saccharophila]|uniref:sulfite exporter TauE/SafE family protein n=1 Tax=Athalassotoga saccharophila TaxID=1441386 RepID=UPI00137B1B56|nr:sulfite exporter TauE/SafE family protein [Athalassotoga saccharophila]BBJ27475.1 sulfite exporter TauE/SafE [Athalassotoga saccharophila]
MDILEIVYGSVIGLSLGLTGAGGSIITIPILIYLLGMNAHVATGTSLVIVGVGALAGAIQYAFGKTKYLHWKVALLFAIAGIVGAFLGSYFNALMPSYLILYLFAALMVVIGIMMLTRKNYGKDDEIPSLKNLKGLSEWSKFVGAGLFIGLMTGFFGVGGGFLIVPVLVLILDFPMKHAIATSLMVIALNCLWGILSRLGGVGTIAWGTALYLVIGAVAGIVIGVLIAKKIRPGSLTKIFAYFVIALAIYMFVRTMGII